MQIWLPILQSGEVAECWDQRIASDVQKKAINIRNEVFYIRGITQGLTLLPMPEGIEKFLDKDGNVIEE